MQIYTKIENTWSWGVSIDIIRTDGIGIICVKLDNDYPITAFISDLTVHLHYRDNGIGRELMDKALEVAKEKGMKFAELNADKNNDWLVAWYKSLGFEITCIGKDEFTMTKIL